VTELPEHRACRQPAGLKDLVEFAAAIDRERRLRMEVAADDGAWKKFKAAFERRVEARVRAQVAEELRAYAARPVPEGHVILLEVEDAARIAEGRKPRIAEETAGV
jgi:hypothetical protein